MEVKALVLNINAGQNEGLMESCMPLRDYSKFVSYVKIYMKEYDKETAINMAVDRAAKENLLEGYFELHRSEVISMILSEYDENATMQMFADESREDEKHETILRVLDAGLGVDAAAIASGTSKEYVLEVQSEMKKQSN